MYPVVRNVFPKFTAQFEGRVAWMYLDVKGLVTIGLGCLIDPYMNAAGLPFVKGATGVKATALEIASEWSRIKGTTALAKAGHRAAKQFCALRLPEPDIDELACHRLEANEKFLFKTFPEFQEWPADAQLAIFSMAWAMGAGFTHQWPLFTAACKRQDWTVAAQNCKMNEKGNPGLIPRNKANIALLLSAAANRALPNSELRGYCANQ